MKSLIFIVLGLWVSWTFTNLDSSSIFQNTFSPLCFFFFLCALITWLVIAAGILDKPRGNSSGEGASFSGGDSGGSGGDGGC